VSENLQNIWTPFKIILIYIVFGSLWILLSDSLLQKLVSDADTLTQIQMYKGWFYVLVTAGFLYGLIKRGSVRQAQIEKSRLEVNRKFTELLENAHDLIFTADLHGNFKSINKAGEEITGYKREEFLKLNFTDIVDESDREYLQMLFSDSKIVESFPSVEINIRRKDGRKITLEVKNKLDKEEGKPTLIQGIARDITQRKLNEDRIKENEARLRSLVETANEGIWTLDELGNITFVNKKLADMLGYDSAEMIGTSYLDHIFENMQIEAERSFNRRRSGISEQLDLKLKKRDGSEVWVIASNSPIFRNNEFIGVLGMLNDITERRHTEEEKTTLAIALESQKTYLKYIISNIPGIVWEMQFNANPNGLDTVFVSDHVEKMLGYSVSEWLTAKDFWLKIIHPDDFENAVIESKRFFESKDLSQQVQHYRWIRKDGGVIWVETRMHVERDKSGNVVSARGVTIDITEQQEAEERLRLSEERFRTLVNASAQIVWRADAEGNIIDADDHRGNKVSISDDDVTKFWVELIHPEDLERVQEKYQNAIKAGSIYNDEYRLLHLKDKTYRHYVSRGIPIFEKDGKIREWIGTITDKTKEIIAQDTLKINEERYRALAHGANVVWLADADGMAIEMPLWEEMTGQTQAEYKGRGWLDAVHSDDVQIIVERWRSALKTKSIFDAEYRVKHKNGEYIFHYGRGVPILNEDGSIREWIGTCTNIDARKKAEQLSRENADRYLAFASSAALFWLADAKGNIHKPDIFLDTVSNADEKTVDSDYYWWIDIIHPDEHEETKNKWKECVETAQIYEIENKVISEDGTFRYLFTRAVPVFDSKGKVREWVGMGVDITDRKKIEKELVEKQKNLDFALKAGKLGTWHIDLRDKSLTYSDGLLKNLGTPLDFELTFQKLGELIHPDDLEINRQAMIQAMKTGEEFYCEHRVITPAGEIRWIDIRGEVIFGEDGRAITLSGTVQNITENKLAQQALLESEERLNTVINNLTEGLIVSDMDGNLLLWNQANSELHGYTHKDENHQSLKDARDIFEMITLDGKVLDFEDWAFPRIIRGEILRNVELKIRRKDIEWERIFSYGGAKVKDAFGQEIAFLTVNDITDKKIAEEALSQSEDRLNTVINNLSEGLVISDMHGNLLAWNPASLEMHGFTSEEELKKPFQNFTEIFELSSLDGKVLEPDNWAISRVLRGQVLRDFEVIIRRKDIEWERIFSYGGAKVKEASGKEVAFVSITDVTDKKRAEVELKKLNEELEQRVIERTKEVHESEERLRLVGEFGTDGFWDWNLKTDEEYFSPNYKALFGYSENEMSNKADSWRQIIFPSDLERVQQAYADHINENKPFDIQVRYRHKNGSIVWVNCRGVALKDDSGEFVRMVGTHINITQQKLAEESLYKLNSQLEQRVLEKTKEVRQSEAHFRQLSESLPLLVWTSRGEDGSCDYLSPQWVEYTGLSEDVQLGFDWLEQIHPDDRAETIGYWKNQADKGELFELEFRIRRFDGVYRWFQTKAVPLKDSSGKVIKWFGTNVEIDDRKLNEQTMQLLKDLSDKVGKSESLETALKEIIDEVRLLTRWDLGEVWIPDEKEENLYLVKSSFSNVEFEEFCKESSKIFFKFGEGLPGLIWKSKQHLWMKELHSDERFLRREIAERAGIKSAIGIPVLMQDKLIAVLNFFSVKAQVEDERGIRLVTNVAAQIGEFLQRKKAENELKQSQARLQLGISVAKMAIIEIDLQNQKAQLSPEAIELFGFSTEKTTISRDELRNMIHPEDRETVFDLVEKALEPNGERLFSVQHRIIRADGEIRWLNVKEQMFFVKNKDQDIIPQKAILVFLDITESKQMEESLRTSEDRLRLLHRIVSDYKLDYRQKIDEIIKLGIEIFGFESGVLGEISDRHYKVIQSVSPANAFEGFECGLSDTICEETIKGESPIAVEDVEKSEWCEKAAFKHWGIKSYFGVSVEKSNKAFGTLCFVGTKKYLSSIGNNDKEFLKLMAQWISAELTRNEAEEALRESEERFRVLFEQSPAGKVVVDLDTLQFVGCNSIATEILGYTTDEIKHLKLSDIDTFKTAEESEFISEKARNGEKIQYETINRTKSGELRNILVVSTGIQVEGKKYSYSSFLDITEMKRAQVELQKERERLEKIAAVSPSGIHSFHASADNEFTFPYVSPAIYNIYGISAEELQKDGTKAFNLFHPDDRNRIAQSIEQSKELMQPWNETWRIIHPEKGLVWVEGHSAPVKESDGGVTWHGILTDVTERTRQANELAERERFISAIFDTAPSMIILWDMQSGTISYANHAASQLLRIEPEQFSKMDKEEIFGRIHPEDIEDVWRFIKTLLKAKDGEVLKHEYRYLNTFGEWRVVLSQDTVFERDKDGKVLKTLNIMEDITERKMAERALRESEERFVKAFEANPAAVVFTRLSDSVIIDANKSFENLFGFKSDEIIGQKFVNLDILLENIPVAALKEYIEQVKDARDLEVKLRTKSGSLIYTLVSNEQIELNGEACLLSIIHDITDRKHAEEELRKTEEKLLQAQKLESVGRLAGGIAHDFNNMLTAINGYSDLTLRQVGEKSPLRHNLEEIRKAGQRSAELTQQLLAFSRKSVLKPETINLNSVVNDTSALLKRLIGEDIVLETVLRSDLHQVKVDPGHLSQIIVNLAVNSRDAMPQGGILTIETANVILDEHYAEFVIGAKAGKYVMLTVSDTGIGMSEDQKEHIFEPFYTTKEVGKGTGLGLATVYGFVKQSDGYIWVYSEINKGTSFKIYLPAIVDKVQKNMEINNNETSKTGSETILLVEDEELVRNLNREILESYGYKVIEARNGVEALKICSEGEIIIDLLMTDVVMPEMGGSELASKLAVSRPDLKVLFTSGYTDDAVIRHGVKDEGTNFLQKPFSLDTLLNKVREVLDK